MLPKYIKVKGFKSYLEEYIDFSQFNDVFCFIGENGSGKSSIIDMITTSLFYQNSATDSRGVGMDNLINSETDRFEIEFEFNMNNIDYKIIRRKIRNGAHELEFYINNQDQTEKISETQIKINNIIKMNYDTFLDTICIGQNQSGRFMKKKPNERKDVFIQVLGLDKYEVLEKYVRELRRNKLIEIEKIEMEITNLENKIKLKDKYNDELLNGNLKIKGYKDNIELKEKELEKIIIEKTKYEQLKQQIDHILNQRSILKSKINKTEIDITSIKNKKLELSLQIEEKDNVKLDVDKIKSQIESNQKLYTKLSNDKASLEATNNMLSNQAKSLKVKYNNLKNYDNADCNFCGHSITKEYKEKYLNDLMSEGKILLNDINLNKDKISELNKDIKDVHSKLLLDNNSLQEKQNKFTKIAQFETQLDSIENKIVELESSLVDYKKEYSDNLNIQIDEIESKEFNDSCLRNEINNLRIKLSEWESIVNIASNYIESIKQAEIKFNQLVKDNDALKLLVSDYESLILAYGKSGIQADIIANTLPEIEDEINDLLNILCNGSVNVEFKTQKDNKNKKSTSKSIASIETLDIIINDENGSRTYETYSGGERFRVDFACHVGLSKFLAKRAGATIDFFMIDEGLGSQDQVAKNQFIMSVKQLSKVFKKIMVITHIDDIKEAFNSKILVEKDPINGSKIRIL